MIIIKLCALVCVVLKIIFLIKKYRIYNQIFENKRDEYVEYLKTIDDIASLKKMGEINPFGVYERWNVSTAKMRGYLEEKVCEKWNKTDSDFLNVIYEYEKNYKKTIGVVFILIFICSIIVPFFYK